MNTKTVLTLHSNPTATPSKVADIRPYVVSSRKSALSLYFPQTGQNANLRTIFDTAIAHSLKAEQPVKASWVSPIMGLLHTHRVSTTLDAQNPQTFEAFQQDVKGILNAAEDLKRAEERALAYKPKQPITLSKGLLESCDILRAMERTNVAEALSRFARTALQEKSEIFGLTNDFRLEQNLELIGQRLTRVPNIPVPLHKADKVIHPPKGKFPETDDEQVFLLRPQLKSLAARPFNKKVAALKNQWIGTAVLMTCNQEQNSKIRHLNFLFDTLFEAHNKHAKAQQKLAFSILHKKAPEPDRSADNHAPGL
ncbi:MAG: hypothetical protein R3D66_06200 [Alphaproteobacteria bacterium]